MSTTDDGPATATEVPARRRTGRPRRTWIRLGKVLAAALSVILVLSAVDVVVVSSRIDHLALTPTSGAAGETWIVVGSDSRADLPAGATTSSFGTTTQVAGARADIVLVVHRAPDGSATTLSLPRDLVLRNRSSELNRLALTFGISPQNMVDSLCVTLGIPTDHLIVVDFAVFTAVIDDLGGIVVDPPTPVRDAYTGLDLTTAGTQRIDGAQALALVRSRHTQEFSGGRWVALSDGAQQRTSWAGVIFRTVTEAAASSRNPILLQRLAWTLGGAVETDQRTSIADLGILSQQVGPVVDVPATALAGGLSVAPSTATYAALAAAGFDRHCTEGT